MKHVNTELIAMFAVDHLSCGLSYRLGVPVVEFTEVLVDFGTGLLDQRQRADYFNRQHQVAKLKIVQRALGLSPVERVGRNFNAAKTVLDGNFFSHGLSAQSNPQRACYHSRRMAGLKSEIFAVNLCNGGHKLV